ncbi:MAG: hypothetical protein IKO53_04695 [Lachnospiraceae bacterium]|nr:hypothetical protein [Lachnospiraceae bacterium]
MTSKVSAFCNGIIDKISVIRGVLLAVLFYMCFCAGVAFVNSPNSYEQAVNFRLFCIGMGLVTLLIMDWKKWISLPVIIWIPVWYVLTHFAYEKHWIADTCNYEFVDVIRYGKLVILVWGAALIANLFTIPKEINKESLLVDIKKPSHIIRLLWILWIILLAIFNPGYGYTAFIVMGYSLFFYVQSDEGIRYTVRSAFFTGTILSFAFVSARSVLQRPFDTERYQLYFQNENAAGEYLAAVMAVLFCRLEMLWHAGDGDDILLINGLIPGFKWLKKGRGIKIAAYAFYYLLIVWDLVLVILNYTRTTILATSVAFFVVFIIDIVKSRKKLFVILRYFAIPILTLVLLYPGFLLVRYMPSKVDNPYFYTWEYNPELKVVQGDPAESPKYTEFTDLLRIVFGKWGILIDFEGDGSAVTHDGSAQTEIIEIDHKDVSNGRSTIWKAYIPRISFSAHYPGNIDLDDGTLIYHAHNTYLQVAYQYGILAGAVLFLLNAASVVVAAVLYFKEGEKKGYLSYPLFTVITVSLGMMTEWMGHPSYIIFIALIFAVGILMHENISKQSMKTKG